MFLRGQIQSGNKKYHYNWRFHAKAYDVNKIVSGNSYTKNERIPGATIEKLIKQFCQGIREFMQLIDAYPFLTPVGIMSRWQRIKMMWPFIKRFNLIRKSMTTLMADFSDKMQSPLLKKAFKVIFYEQHPSFPLLPFYFKEDKLKRN